MQILHGTWIPQAGEEFIQKGGFYLWVETTERKRFRNPSQRHPRQLVAADLAGLLTKELGIQSPNFRKLEDSISPQYFLLPTVDNQPLPSLELSRYLEAELPEAFEFQYWQVDCYQAIASAKTGGYVNNVVSLLNDLHFLALHNLADIQLGSDLLFWFYYTQALKRIIFKDQYIPALKYRELEVPQTSSKRKSANEKAETSTAQSRHRTTSRKRQTRSALKANQAIDVTAEPQTGWEIYPGWEFIGEEYETTIRQYVEYMPLVCVSGLAEPRETPEFYDRATLLRHFSECLLTDIVTHTPSTQAFEKTIADSLLYDCLHPTSSGIPWTAAKLEQYQQWQNWRDRIVRTQSDQPFYLCFQLQDPGQIRRGVGTSVSGDSQERSIPARVSTRLLADAPQPAEAVAQTTGTRF
jgi:hypothetical protein